MTVGRPHRPSVDAVVRIRQKQFETFLVVLNSMSFIFLNTYSSHNRLFVSNLIFICFIPIRVPLFGAFDFIHIQCIVFTYFIPFSYFSNIIYIFRIIVKIFYTYVLKSMLYQLVTFNMRSGSISK